MRCRQGEAEQELIDWVGSDGDMTFKNYETRHCTHCVEQIPIDARPDLKYVSKTQCIALQSSMINSKNP